MSFSTVDGPNLGQHPTFDPGSSLLWELSTLKVAQGGRRPTAVLKDIAPTALMGGWLWVPHTVSWVVKLLEERDL